jgi:hypothetical protein
MKNTGGKNWNFFVVKNKRYKVIYYIEKDIIHISAIFDCRQDPEKLRNIIYH